MHKITIINHKTYMDGYKLDKHTNCALSKNLIIDILISGVNFYHCWVWFIIVNVF